MEWPAARERDQVFGPRFPDQFDFTLRFEHLILTIAPSLVFIFSSLAYLRFYYREPVYTRTGILKWAKLVRLLQEPTGLHLHCSGQRQN